MTILYNLFDGITEQYEVIFTISTTSWIPSLNNQQFSTNMILSANQKPYNGHCTVDLSSGYALITYFTITCLDWMDMDGIVVKYEYFSKFNFQNNFYFFKKTNVNINAKNSKNSSLV